MPQPTLARKLSFTDAVFIGLAAMVGAGIFTAISPAIASAGTWWWLALCLAASVAFCNAASSAELAALYPQSGGTYVYAGKQLHPLAGFIAGACFLCGKTASGAAMALAFAHYAYPELAKPLALAAIALLTGINLLGIEKTARVSRGIVVTVIFGLLVFVGLCLSADSATATANPPHSDVNPTAILQGAALWFFAFAGYARLATLAEEVKNPARVLNKAIITALCCALALFALVSFSAVKVAGHEALAASSAPLVTALQAAGFGQWQFAIGALAALACLGVLLSLIAGISRTLLAMSRQGDMPSALNTVHHTYRTPVRCELAVAVAMALAVLLLDLHQAIGFSAFSVLLYYALANANALTLKKTNKTWPRVISIAGLTGCILLAFALPLSTVVISLIILLLFTIYYLVTVKLKPGQK